MAILGFLGFAEDHRLIKKKDRQIWIDNLDSQLYEEFIATYPPANLSATDTLPSPKQTLFNFTHFFDDSKVHTFPTLRTISIVENALEDRPLFYALVDESLKEIQKGFNINIAIDKTGTFVFPSHDQESMPTLTLIVSEIVSYMCGYGTVNYIDRETNKVTGSTQSNVKASYEESAFILSMDTGMTYLTANYIGGSMLVGSQESFIAELRPFSEGILAMESVSSYFQLSEDLSGSEFVQLDFYLWTDHNQKRFPFSWNCKARIVGVIKSTILKEKPSVSSYQSLW